jgi:hypothetical protein
MFSLAHSIAHEDASIIVSRSLPKAYLVGVGKSFSARQIHQRPPKGQLQHDSIVSRAQSKEFNDNNLPLREFSFKLAN